MLARISLTTVSFLAMHFVISMDQVQRHSSQKFFKSLAVAHCAVLLPLGMQCCMQVTKNARTWAVASSLLFAIHSVWHWTVIKELIGRRTSAAAMANGQMQRMAPCKEGLGVCAQIAVLVICTADVLGSAGYW